MKASLATVVIPVYNGERFLDETIQSVLGQDYRPIEIIVVDDGSSDQTAPVARMYQEVTYIYQRNQGQTSAMNAGLQASSGEYISFLDSDDLFVADKLSRHIDFFHAHQEVDIIISQMKNFQDPSFDSRLFPANTIDDSSENRVFSTATIRKAVFEKVGNFDISYKHAKEIDWLFRAKEVGVVIEIDPAVVLSRRLHDSNMSYHIEAKSAEYMLAVRSSILRKRRARRSES